MLFNLTNFKTFACEIKESAVFNHSNYGPYFGGETAALSLYTDKNGVLKCFSSTKQKVYEIGTDDYGKSKLTNQLNEEFKIANVEVWQIMNDDFLPPSGPCIIF